MRCKSFDHRRHHFGYVENFLIHFTCLSFIRICTQLLIKLNLVCCCMPLASAAGDFPSSQLKDKQKKGISFLTIYLFTIISRPPANSPPLTVPGRRPARARLNFTLTGLTRSIKTYRRNKTCPLLQFPIKNYTITLHQKC